ncbi:hypothetical protein [Bifidobacterium sp. SO4]|uniref:hypothetical protein n=1 Tax=Bifidobacterium sp. SO4 TaxID=2809030 RepID=UPI001BDD1DD3|nr:hypothetical protein [Bifidobacterium sp. SO4]MBT1171261.1 hypothetical protein [Bifidobacterium sp. SO4]
MMADTEETTATTIAVNHVPQGWLANPLAQASNVTQATRGDGSLAVTLAEGATDGYVRPWAGVAKPVGDVVGVLLLSSVDGLTPAGGESLDGATGLIWLRGGAAAYSHVMAVRATDLSQVRLHAPANRKPLTLVRVGLFDMDSWTQMQSRDIIYFDGGGITQAASDGYILPPATSVSLGGVIIDTSTLSITPEGVLSALRQEIPVASQDTLGGVKPGRGVQVSADGTLTARLGKNLNFDANGAIEAPDIESPDMSDYPTKSQLTSTLDSYVTKELADATYEKKGSGSGSGEKVDAYTKSESDSRYVQKEAQTFTIGGGAGKVVVEGDHVGIVYGDGHLDLNPGYAALSFGKYNIMIEPGGIRLNGVKGTTTF